MISSFLVAIANLTLNKRTCCNKRWQCIGGMCVDAAAAAAAVVKININYNCMKRVVTIQLAATQNKTVESVEINMNFFSEY